MDLKFIEDLLKTVRSLDIVREPAVKARQDFEEKIGVIQKEETKKLFVYYSSVLEKKINLMNEKLFDLINSDDQMIRIDKVEKLAKEIDIMIDKQILAHILFKNALEQEIGPQDSIFIIRVAKDWEVVKVKSINCEVSSSMEWLDKIFAQSFNKGVNPNWN